MKFLKLSVSLLTTSVLLAASLPVRANSLFSTSSSPSKGLFSNSSATSSPQPKSVNSSQITTPSQNNASVGPAAGSEVAPLGTHDAWLTSKNFEKDPTALCNKSDVGLGSDIKSISGKKKTTSSIHKTWNKYSKKSGSGGGGGSFLKIIKANASAKVDLTKKNKGSFHSKSSSSEENKYHTETVKVGKSIDCSSVVEWSAKRDMNYEDNLTQRYAIKMGRTGQQVDGLLRTKR